MRTETKSTRNSKIIKASPQKIYDAFTTPEALKVWLAPGDMTSKVHNFEFKEGGGYTMSLFYPASEKEFRGKTTEKEDRFTARFIELVPGKKIVQVINFDTNDPVLLEK